MAILLMSFWDAVSPSSYYMPHGHNMQMSSYMYPQHQTAAQSFGVYHTGMP